ncbi:GNAT family N-acetyltransferase [Bacillus luteolus]|uniref:GNAT family N-acetyltransferase n=1 Tax=Litchfieldia luteola TaxID=682179 RepID=A0ABR9QMW9_9BACI|nr:GNAT family N-acetyltransferase [Cytobacillus luteolus]MBE4909845.1 GNAT family N-acetyltransferase [Cytobacillus luteolus]MBP1942606.1 N-acetylglutamate synthase-like GNAT family acetyltransferase [Cytobacillus luteolus]
MIDTQLIEVDSKTLEGIGSYCLRSKKNSLGYINKNKWLNERFEEGLKYIQLFENKKQVGFIEYSDAAFSSRVVHADDYLVIHCLWVSETGKGYGTKLINKCLIDARENSKKGVVVVTNPETSWTPSKDIFVKNGFKLIDEAPYNFSLLVYQFEDSTSLPFFPSNWDERVNRFDELTILRSFQCPYVEVATENIIEGASRLGIQANIIDLKNREELMELSPTPYGIYSVIFKGKLISFHRLTVHSVIKRLKEIM